MLLNVVIPISTATVKDGPGECRGAEDYGRVPFDVSFTCTRTTGGQTGCSYSGQFALDLLAGTKRKYLCDKAWSGAIPQPDQVQVLLSGVQADTGSKMKHHNFRVSIKLDAYNVSTYVADWSATVEWEDRADVMVDSFDVTVHANLHWSATGDIRFQELSLACASTSGADCTTSSGFNVGAGNTLGGLAFGELSLSADNATTGMEPDGFLASLEKSFVSGTTWNVKTKCRVGAAAGMSCTNRAILIYGLAAALDPVEFDWSTQSLLSGPQPTSLASGFSEATGTKAVMNCGLRAFQSYEAFTSSFKYSSIWFGQASADCMWFGGNSYKGNTLFGLENDVGDFHVENFADALRVP